MRRAIGITIGLITAAGSAGTALADPVPDALSAMTLRIGRITPIEARVAPDFRVRLSMLATAVSFNPLLDPDGPMQRRFASSMIDYYPLNGSGLHLSGGMKFFSVANFVRDAEKATGGLLYMPRLPGTGTGIRTGFNRRTPAATVGYSGTYRNAMYGLEMGTLVGTANADLPRSYRALSERRGGLNPIANLVVGMKF